MISNMRSSPRANIGWSQKGLSGGQTHSRPGASSELRMDSTPYASHSKGGGTPSEAIDVDSPMQDDHDGSDQSSEAAPEITVWTEDMDLDDLSSDDGHDEEMSIRDDQSEHDEQDDDEEHPSKQPIEDDVAANSLPSSLSTLSDISDVSSRLSGISSKATTPLEAEAARESLRPESGAEKSPCFRQSTRDIDRLTFNIQSKASVPHDIPAYQYAAECVDAAESSRLNPYALHPEEYHLLRHHISHTQVTTYLNVRNGILRLWMRQPWIAVTRQEAVGCANARWFDAASVCYDWLVRRGYINYGCVKLPEARIPEESNKRRRTVAVIGAGISGLSCARQLEGLFTQYAAHFDDLGELPPRVVVLEGRSRVGGRVYSREFKTRHENGNGEFKDKRHTAEMGGMIITGFDRGNPMNVLVRGQLGLPYHALTADTTIYDTSGKPVDPVRDQLVEQLYNDCLDRVSEYKYKAKPAKMIEGNRDLVDEGKDSLGDGSKSIMQAEEATAALPDAPSVSEQNVPEKMNMIPVSSDKLTGRVHTQPGVAATHKASDKAKLMGWTLKSKSAEAQDVDLDKAVSAEGATLGSVLDHAISEYKGLVDLTAQDHRLLNWHIANLEYSNATNLHKLSLELWDIDAGNEWEGSHTMVVGGYQSVARGLLHCPTSLDLKTQFPVKSIKYQSESVSGPAQIECEDGSVIEADAVVCTAPLGVLKSDTVAFDPPLPSWKTQAIQRLGFGILNKVVLVYDRVFWESDRHIFGTLRAAPDHRSTSQQDYSKNRGRFFQWFNVSNTTGLPCLIALMAGDAGFDTEHSTNEDLVNEATEILRGVFGASVPFPVDSVVTRWGSDRFARGSYSSAAPNMHPEDYDVMSRSVGNLFFAGEHTIGTHPATVHGAYLSGLRAASEVLETMLGPIEVPTPLILPKDSLLLHKRKIAALDPKQARLEAYEAEIWDFIRSKIGERPTRPAKVAANAYLLYSKDNFDLARKKCDEARKPGKKSVPNEVRVMTSKMWKDATPEERKPFEIQAAEQKRAYADAMLVFVSSSETWDQEALVLRKEYEQSNPTRPTAEELAQRAPAAKHRRGRLSLHVEEGEAMLAL